MTYYVIRHKASNILMPLLDKNRGYSHWNPNSDVKLVAIDTGVPRLFKSERIAKAAIKAWILTPNAERVIYISSYNEDVYDLKTKDDGRKIEDLEILQAYVTLENM